MKNIIRSLWVGPSLSNVERLCINSFLNNGHEFNLYVYEDIEGIPDGTTVRDANVVMHESKVFTNKKRKHKKTKNVTYALFSDLFRFELLNKFGGFWVDMDMICLKPFKFEEDYVFAEESEGSLNVAALKLPQKSKLLEHYKMISENPHNFQPWDTRKKKAKKLINKLVKGNRVVDVKWGELGPKALTNLVNYYGLQQYIKPFTFFYPVTFGNWHTLFNETFKGSMDFFNGSYAVHLWNENIRRHPDFDKDGSFPKNSAFETLKRRYL